MKLRLFLFLLLIVAGTLVVAMTQAPDLSSVTVNTCIQTTDGDCVRFPQVTGETLNSATAELPDFFTGEYNLVIVPFDREQQEGVLDWLPVAQDLVDEYEGLSYYSVGALPDLPTGVRLLISGGMTLAVDADVRDISVLLYLENQALFADSLDTTVDETALFILNQAGEVVWQASGAFNETLADTLRQQIAELNWVNKLKL